MNTRLNLDDGIIKQAMLLTGMKNPQDVVDFALRELLANLKKVHSNKNVVNSRGKK